MSEVQDRDCDRQNSHVDRRWDSQLSFLPDKLQQRLMPFQKEGVKFALSKNGRCMIADEMGLGKTVQAISVAYAYRQEWPLLIVVPSSLKYLWIEEMERWIPELNPGDINLVETKRDTLGISSSKVTVLGYGLLTTDARPLVEALTRQRFNVVVVDESHYLKSRNAARSKILVPLIQNAKRAILLTGTPALGRPEELFMQIEALYPRMFGTWSDYAKQYCNAHYRFLGNRRQWDCRGASHLEELHQRLSEIMIRRLKVQVLPQLPPKIRQRIPFDLPKDAAKEASGSLEEWERLMRTMGSGVSATDNPFAEVMGLVTRMYKQTAIAKAGAVKDYIKMLLETEKLKFLVFAHHLTMLQACSEAVIEAKASYIRIDGSVPSSERIHLVHQFQNDPETRVAVLSIQAAGQGLTFTAATHVVFAELYWNPGHVKQAEDRAHRIGQTASVHVHYLIAKGTFDTVMWGMLNRKETVTGSTLNGKKEYLKAELGDKDKWDFLNFAEAWTPSETTLAAVENDKDPVFFNHFEKDKQHDIRSFFSPDAGKEKKRKRTEGEVCLSPVTPSEKEGSIDVENPENDKEKIFNSQDPPDLQDLDFSPQVKRLRLPTPSATHSPRSRLGGKRRSLHGGRDTSSSPLASLFTPRRLSDKGTPKPRLSPRPGPPDQGKGDEWSCGACTYSNSILLLYCELCESPLHRPSTAPDTQSTGSPAVSAGSRPDQSTPREHPWMLLSGSDSEQKDPPCPGPASPGTTEPQTDGQPRGQEEERQTDGQPREQEERQTDGQQREQEEERQTDGQQREQEEEERQTDGQQREQEEEERQTDGQQREQEEEERQTDGQQREQEEEKLKGKQSPGENQSAPHEHTDAQTDSVSSPADDTTASLPLYPNMKFCASKNTERIYLYSQEDSPLHWNFIPLDIKLDSWEDLPEAFRRRENRTQVLRFVQQWSTLTAMKQRLIRRSGLLFCSPVLALDQLTSTQRKHSSTKRYLTKEDVSQASLSKAQCDGGTVRMVNKEIFFTKRRTTSMSRPNTSASVPEKPSEVHPEPPVGAPEGPSEAEAGYLQVLDSEGRALCLSCHKACGSTGGAWDNCFCSQTCQEEFQLRSSQAYMRARVLQTEQGVCQSCGLQAHQLYLKVRDAPPTHRKEMLENTWLAQLSLKQLNEMIRAPVEGQFWQVDHIRPVYSGGGQCSLDNLQTLCTVCHRTRTAQQAKDRSQMKKGLAASKVASDITRFFIKK
ncbi:DNA annealing helicase and endonuclease ZRANB3-like isoform X1 [Salvelinus fontinalis]|uniref:DNA annealing helicase and endonuclease ZRANB3-like isoform X1 n=1 Tax=Salvelinus fontinalis TaxID=8038 RepID=UPI00248507B0|nr:DNA annealing helicase and endonuclease ZRANB3-like isoform X1 [Salvelinus fontinalis]XP_055770448.1 DNA annealing helicase and endonuclease ZRANB3-like isoform X1 [Salvelinus fontinalis]XP_055770449.1 DNA annealing helicase and endonuclease ZRANB3-like isoform X1 [Salvelinus fontinalis]